jgi:Iap family predicted aminopeptidase
VNGADDAAERGRFVGAAGSFCSAEARDQVVAFFCDAQGRVVGARAQAGVDQINDCIELRANQEANLQEWLAQH